MIKIQRRSPSFWDELNVPPDTRAAHLFTWLESVAPTPEEHDFVLSTDGSGCTRGWGASASIIQQVIPHEILGRTLGKYQPIISGTYGSTVQRREFSALLDGLHEILRLCLEVPWEEEEDEEANLKKLMRFTGENRITVLWYTDRSNLAKSLMFDEDGNVLNKRSSEIDLWMRYSSIARYFCITPMCTPRNTIPAQKTCDALCEIARRAMVNSAEQYKEAIGFTLHESWNQPRPQKASF